MVKYGNIFELLIKATATVQKAFYYFITLIDTDFIKLIVLTCFVRFRQHFSLKIIFDSCVSSQMVTG